MINFFLSIVLSIVKFKILADKNFATGVRNKLAEIILVVGKCPPDEETLSFSYRQYHYFPNDGITSPYLKRSKGLRLFNLPDRRKEVI
jgi:hypothetical protein